MDIHSEDVKEAAAAVPQDVIEELEVLRKYPQNLPTSVAHSGLVYVGGCIAKLISDVGHDACAMLVTKNKMSSSLYNLLSQQQTHVLHYPTPEFLAMLETIVTFLKSQSNIYKQKSWNP